MDPQVRASLGKHYRLMEEINHDNEHRNEKKLHRDIENLLRLKGIVYVHARTDRKTTQQKGVPDFLFALALQKPSKHDPTGATCVPVPCAWEIKTDKAKLRPEQEIMMRDMMRPPNGWYVKVIRSLQEAADELKALGI